jgi:hypothetical protein
VSLKQLYFRTVCDCSYFCEEDAADDDELYEDDAKLGIEYLAHLNCL